MSNKLETLDVVQAAEFKYACQRNNLTNAHVKAMSSGDFLANVCGVLDGIMEIVPRKLVTWRKIQIGDQSIAGYTDTLTSAGIKISSYASQILKKMGLAKTLTEVELVVVSVAELGFSNGATFDQMVNRARELGLDLCPAEVGPALRMCYRDQPKDEWLKIAMKSIADSDGYFKVFIVERDGDGLWLYTYWFRRGDVLDPDDRWGFCRK